MDKHSFKQPLHIKNRSSAPIRLAFIYLISFTVSCSSIKQTEKRIERNFTEFPVFKQGYAGFALYDPASDKMLFTYNADKYFTPASNTKLFTLYTGLKVLGDSIPALKYSISGGSLIFKGTGDPSFLNPDLPASKILPFFQNATDSLFYAPPIFREKHFGPGWAWDDYDSYYATEKTDFPIYGNLIEVRFDSSNIKPTVKPEIFSDSITGTSIHSKKNKYAQREISSNKMTFQDFEREKNFTQWIPIKFSSHLIPELLSDSLKKPVKLYTGNLQHLNFENTIYSVPTDSLYKRMMQVSDNFIAEQILLLAADKISDTLKTNIAIDYMKKNYLADLPDEPMWYDGSGLSRYNLFTPRSVVKLIEKIEAEMPREKLFQILAAGGKSGTLKNYYDADAPYIYAKTGTLRNNHSLSGFLITKSGRILIFSFMNSNYVVPTSELKQAMTAILEQVRDHY